MDSSVFYLLHLVFLSSKERVVSYKLLVNPLNALKSWNIIFDSSFQTPFIFIEKV